MSQKSIHQQSQCVSKSGQEQIHIYVQNSQISGFIETPGSQIRIDWTEDTESCYKNTI